MKVSPPTNQSKGFSLVEVMVALVICSVGLLGLAKMESLALVSTSVAGSRSLAAIQAASLAAAMHANRAYWGAGLAKGTTVFNQITIPVPPKVCTTAGASACGVSDMAAYDLQQWGNAVAAVLPGYLATITCSTVGLPINCTIQLTWAENGVAANAKQTNMATIATYTPTYTLYVEP